MLGTNQTGWGGGQSIGQTHLFNMLVQRFLNKLQQVRMFLFQVLSLSLRLLVLLLIAQIDLTLTHRFELFPIVLREVLNQQLIDRFCQIEDLVSFFTNCLHVW